MSNEITAIASFKRRYSNERVCIGIVARGEGRLKTITFIKVIPEDAQEKLVDEIKPDAPVDETKPVIHRTVLARW